MEITCTPVTRNDKPSRLFTTSLNPEETQRILQSPWYIQEPRVGGAEFCILKTARKLDKEEICFEFNSTGCYEFTSQSGFKTDKAHLKWLLSLGEIPMIDSEVVVGYVAFKAA